MFSHGVHAYLRALAGLRAHRVGPFLACFDDHDVGLFRNYSVPGDGVDPTPDQAAEPWTRPPVAGRSGGACPTVGITTPFLTPAGEAEERIYRRVGYRPVTEMLHISR
ncbi:MAG: hypothetical protein ACRDRW_12640 [Pseudonocardiaceae bacterium]